MENCDSIYNVVLQSSTIGISAVEIAHKLGKNDDYRTTVTRHLNILEGKGAVRSDKGKWIAKENFSVDDLDEPKIRLFKYIVEHGDSPIIQDALAEIELNMFTEPLRNFETLSNRERLKRMKQAKEAVSNSKTKAILKLIEQLGSKKEVSQSK